MADTPDENYQLFDRLFSGRYVGLINDLGEIHEISICIVEIAESIESILGPYSKRPITTTNNPGLTRGLEILTQSLDHACNDLKTTSKSIHQIPETI